MGKKGEPRGPKLQKWLKYYLDETNKATFLNKTNSSKFAGYKCKDDLSFANVGYQNFKKLQPEIDQWLDEHGLSKNALKMKLVSLLECKEVKIMTVKGKVRKEDLPPNVQVVAEFVSPSNKTMNGEQIPDIETVISIRVDSKETQRRTLDMALKVIPDGYAPTKQDHKITAGGVLRVPGLIEESKWNGIADPNGGTEKGK